MPLDSRMGEKPDSECEIEITPEMIEAGADYLWREAGLGNVIGPSDAETFARIVLGRALEVRRRKNAVSSDIAPTGSGVPDRGV